MIIVAKYPSACACCPVPVRVGDRIEWSKGAPVKHEACAAKPGTVKATATAPSTPPRTPARSASRSASRSYECEECGDRVYPGTQCWETGMRH